MVGVGGAARRCFVVPGPKWRVLGPCLVSGPCRQLHVTTFWGKLWISWRLLVWCAGMMAQYARKSVLARTPSDAVFVSLCFLRASEGHCRASSALSCCTEQQQQLPRQLVVKVMRHQQPACGRCVDTGSATRCVWLQAGAVCNKQLMRG
jgi:hypothetical protein